MNMIGMHVSPLARVLQRLFFVPLSSYYYTSNYSQTSNYISLQSLCDTKDPGTYLFEPPGETHTLVVDEDCEEMVTLFHVTGSLLYVSEDNDDEVIGFDDVFTKVSLFLKTLFLIEVHNHFHPFN